MSVSYLDSEEGIAELQRLKSVLTLSYGPQGVYVTFKPPFLRRTLHIFIICLSSSAFPIYSLNLCALFSVLLLLFKNPESM